MRTNTQAIKQYQQKQIESLLQEVKHFGDFKSQLKALQSFREELKPFYRWKLLDRFVGYRIKKIQSGDVIDHHITAYFAPLTFKRKSWGGGQNSPVEHIVKLSNALKQHQTRLIYVSLPLKLSIYPELVAKDSTFFKGASTLPQFRQMTWELLQKGVEVLDIFPIFMQHKRDCDTHLFSKGHHISYEGASLVAQIIADYIRQTTDFTPDNAHFEARKTLWHSCEKTTIYKEGEIYIADKKDSPFCIFGNCNLQAYTQEGAGIASNLTFALNKEVEDLGRKLIFSSDEPFDKNTFDECAKREIAICISFLSGSFVRTSAIYGKTKRKMLWNILRGKQNLKTSWSTLALELQG